MNGIPKIKSVIPHRWPILLIDRVADVVPGQRLTAYKAVTAAEPCYQSLPDTAAEEDYAYPVALLLESWAQSAVMLACWDTPNPDVLGGKVELAASIKGVRLPAPVYPGQLVEHQVELLRRVDDAAVVSGRSSVGGSAVLEVGQAVVALRDADVLRRPTGASA